MYLTHFDFDRMPFGETTRVRHQVEIAEQRAAEVAIVRALESDPDLLELIGGAGTGKSTVLARLASSLPNTVVIRARAATSPPERSLLEGVGTALGCSFGPETSATELKRMLRSELHGRSERGDRLRLLVDDADALDESALLALWSLGTADAGRARRVTLLLCGKPSLAPLLARPALADLPIGDIVRVRLESVDRHGCRHYVRRRLMLAGSTTPALFTPSAIDRIQLGTEGNLSLVNTLCHRSLLAACEDREYQVGRRHVARAIDATDGITRWKTRPLAGRPLVSGAVTKRAGTKWNHPHGQPS